MPPPDAALGVGRAAAWALRVHHLYPPCQSHTCGAQGKLSGRWQGHDGSLSQLWEAHGLCRRSAYVLDWLLEVHWACEVCVLQVTLPGKSTHA